MNNRNNPVILLDHLSASSIGDLVKIVRVVISDTYKHIHTTDNKCDKGRCCRLSFRNLWVTSSQFKTVTVKEFLPIHFRFCLLLSVFEFTLSNYRFLTFFHFFSPTLDAPLLEWMQQKVRGRYRPGILFSPNMTNSVKHSQRQPT